jgi:hypothetical protein
MPLYLSLRWPLATAQVQSVPVYYNITLAIFYPDGVTNTTTMFTLQYKVTTDGTASSPAVFEYVSGAPEQYYTPGE